MSDFLARSARLTLGGVPFNGPVFTAGIVKLHHAFAALEGYVDSQQLDKATRRLAAYRIQEPLMTSDGTPWFWGRRAFVDGGTIVVLLPTCTDWGRQDETLTDRHVAAYFAGKVALCEIDEMADSLRLALPQPLMPGPPAESAREWAAL